MDMEPPPNVRFLSDLHLLLWKPTGALHEKGGNKILAYIGEEEAISDSNELRYVDTTGLTAIDLNFRYVFHVALYRRLSRKDRPQLKSAFLVNDLGFAHYIKLHAVLTDHSPLQVRLFEHRAGAANWLNVPAEV